MIQQLEKDFSASSTPVKEGLEVAPKLDEKTLSEEIKEILKGHDVSDRVLETLEQAEQGNMQAMKDMFYFINNKRGGLGDVPKSDGLWELGHKLLQISATSGNKGAISDLAYVKYHGLHGVKASPEEALQNMQDAGYKSKAEVFQKWDRNYKSRPEDEVPFDKVKATSVDLKDQQEPKEIKDVVVETQPKEPAAVEKIDPVVSPTKTVSNGDYKIGPSIVAEPIAPVIPIDPMDTKEDGTRSTVVLPSRKPSPDLLSPTKLEDKQDDRVPSGFKFKHIPIEKVPEMYGHGLLKIPLDDRTFILDGGLSDALKAKGVENPYACETSRINDDSAYSVKCPQDPVTSSVFLNR